MSIANCVGWGGGIDIHPHPDRLALRPPHNGGGENYAA
jgi:hypothetical protein